MSYECICQTHIRVYVYNFALSNLLFYSFAGTLSRKYRNNIISFRHCSGIFTFLYLVFMLLGITSC